MLDYRTNGNYPRWFTEGLAQRVEYKLTGYLWIESGSSLDQDLYSLEEMTEQFDTLTNQPLVYRQSFLLVDYLARTYGEEALADLVALLGNGVKFDTAISKITGATTRALYHTWLEWVDEHLEDLEAAG